MLRLVAVLAALGTAWGVGSGVWLDVPFVKQKKNGCGAASIAMIQGFWFGRPGPPEEAGEMLGSEMEKRLQGLGFRTFVFEGRWEDLESHLAKGRPLIACLKPGGRSASLHYVVVAGLDGERDFLMVNDPAQRKLMKVERGEFERQWRASGNWTLLAVPSAISPQADAKPAVERSGSDRLALERAGLAFQRQDYAAAKVNIRRALRVDPDDAYAHDFLATLYFLDGNVEAALRHWNRAGKPRIEQIKMDPAPAVDPIVLDRAFAFSPGGVLELDDYLATRARLEHLEIWRHYRLDLMPGPEQKFDVVFRAAEPGLAGNLISSLRGALYQTVYPEWINVRRSGWNLSSQLRWDAEKRRASVAFAGPLGRNPTRKLRLLADARDENWDIGSPLKLQRFAAGLEVDGLAGSRLGWRSGVFAVNRRVWSAATPFSSGPSLQYRAGADLAALRIPERRLTVTTGGTWQLGRVFRAAGMFSQLQGSLEARWFPMARGEDYATRLRFRGGTSRGAVPFDELFGLGLDRDHELWLRAHPAVREGKKGAGPLGRDFMLLNWELDKTVYQGSFLRLTVGPFVDGGAARRPASGQWMWDTGAQAKVRALGGVTVALSYGRDLRTGRDVFFATAGR